MTLAGFREVWTSTHGRAARYHISIDGTAACAPNPTSGSGNRRMLLGDILDAADVPPILRCRRRACANRWPIDPSRLPVAIDPCDKDCRDSLSLAKGSPMVTAQHAIARRTAKATDILLEHEHFHNPRTFTGLDDKDIEALGTEIKEHGLLDPPTVQRIKLSNGDIVDLAIDGQRRILAVKEKLPRGTEIPVIDLTEEPIEMTPEAGDRLVNIALQSLRREGLSSYELVAVAVNKKKQGQSLDEISDAIGKSKSWCSRMLNAWDAATEKLKLEWRKGKLTDEQFKDLAEVKEPEKQVEKAKEVIAARESGDKAEARVLAKETKETARAAKKDAAKPPAKVTNGVNEHKPAVPRAVTGEQRELFADEGSADKANRQKRENAPVAPPRKPPSKLAVEEVLALAEKRPPTADFVKGVLMGIRWREGLVEMDSFGKAWNQYVSRVKGEPKPVKAKKAKAPAKPRDAAKARAAAAKGVITKAKKAERAKKAAKAKR